MEKDRQSDSYEQLFVLFSDKVEKILKCCIGCLVALFVIAQLALQFPAVRHTVSRVERLEGVPYDALHVLPRTGAADADDAHEK